ncbi:hypothetical protein [Sphaerimonospora thailandensis]|uniref:Uncharacterized protein n=1 Tax=Sphaerimonospora thailandensis TaxID=795644 RepID=A0A8J3RAB5_9ACTN|nr:hypothetical protein [Sphaerimonospora thailandensis]GIH68923.1 hypothetical protein Mth01_11760 [Sphaerimonospora thailandensis]
MFTRHAASLLDLLERDWAHRLGQVSLAAEVNADETMVEAAAGALGEMYRELRRGRHLELARRWPACLVVALSGVAATGYRSGSCWPSWWAATRFRGRTSDAAAFGEAFLSALHRLGLPRLPEQAGANRHISQILMHAGVPTSCLLGFFRFLLDGRSDALDEPVRRFLEHGGDYAADLAERCLDLLDRLRSPEPDLAGLTLPARIMDHARALVRDRLLDPTPDEERPELLLTPLGQGVRLRLPAAIGPAAVTIDTDTDTGTGTGTGTGEETIDVRPGDLVPIVRPTRSARVSWRAGTREIRLDIVDPADPLLVFTEDGRHLPPGRSLPADAVWCMFPKDREPTADGPLRIIVESPPPVGWSGWRLVQISPGQATWIALSDSHGGAAGSGGPRRQIRGKDRPRVRTGAAITGVTTPDDAPVFTGVSVWLPGGGLTWSVEVRQAGRSVFRDSFTPGEPVEITDLWDGVGEITVMVRGPIGLASRRKVMVAGGLAVRHDPQPRPLAPDGLAPARAHISGSEGNATLSFAADETAHVFTYGGTRLVLTPPHMRVATDRHEWRASPLRLAVEELETIEWLRIDGAEAGPLEVRADGRAVQELTPSARGRYSLRRALDTVTACQGADLILPPDVPVAYVRPAGAVSGVTHLGDRLLLTDLVWLEGLVAEIRPGCDLDGGSAEIVPVPPHGVLTLPRRLAAAGSLHVRLAVPDPWTGPNWPPDPLVCANPGPATTP